MASRDSDNIPMQAIALVGPTAAGKSGIAMAFAAALDGQVEIISMDSAQVYRGMDIGTAKPSPQERQQVRHHLIDILDPGASYSAAAFARDATALIGEITARGHLPLLVGGTMLYLRALRHGLDEMPASDPQVRQQIDAMAQEHGWPWLHRQLALADPPTAARLNPNDAQRIQRALEVFRISGRPLSTFQLARQSSAQGHGDKQAPARPGIRILSLEPSQRAWLHERIAARFDAMLANGLVEEVRCLRERGDLHAALPSMRCVGYRQVWQALEGTLPWAQLREKGIAATRQLAKRQLTWLRALHERKALACDAPDVLRQALQWLKSAP
jgi:tRNA dimethylallyltransferase